MTARKVLSRRTSSPARGEDEIVLSTSDISDIIPPSIIRDPTGFANNTLIVESYDATARTITLSGTVSAYYQGSLISALVPGWVSAAHAATDGFWYLSYGASGFTWSLNTPWNFYDVQIAGVYRSGSHIFGLRECHEFMPWQSHQEDHKNIGTYKISGGDLSGIVIGSTTAADRRPAISACVIQDEDNPTTNAALAAGGPYTQFYLTGSASDDFNLVTADIVPLSTANPYYNLNTSGTWSQALMPANSVASVFLLEIPVTSDAGSQQYRHVWIQPQWFTQAQNSSTGAMTTAQATEEAIPVSNLSLGSLGTALPEFVVIQRVTIKYTGGNWSVMNKLTVTGSRFNQTTVGSGLSSVSTDATLSGTGTLANPLIVTGDPMSRIASARSSTQRVLAKLKRGVDNATILVIGDSTSAYSVDWPYLLAGMLATDWPTCTVNYYIWDTGTNAYDAATIIQTGSGSQVISIYNFSVPGTQPDYCQGSYWALGITAPAPDLVLINHGHNMGTDLGAVATGYLNLTEALLEAMPWVSICAIGQNPEIGSNVQTQRQTYVEWVAEARGFGYINTCQAFFDYGATWTTDLMTNSVHPNNTGQILWANLVHASFLYSSSNPLSKQQVSTLSNAPGQQLVINGRFTAFSGSAPDYWTLYGGATAAQNTSTYESENGYSVTLTNNPAGSSGIQQNVGISETIGKWVTVTARVYVPVGSGVNTGAIFIRDGVTASPEYVGLSNATNGWRWAVVTAFIPTNATECLVDFSFSAAAYSSAIYIDQVSVSIGRFPRKNSDRSSTSVLGTTVVNSLKLSGTSATTTINLSSTNGVVFRGSAGSSYDYMLLTPSGSNSVWGVPTGTYNVEFFGTVKFDSLSASMAVVSDSSNNLASSVTTSVELGYSSGLRSAIQTQIDTKATSSTDLPVCMGDGVTIQFLWDGTRSIYRQDWQGKQLLYSTARTNFCPYSANLDNAAWTATIGGTGSSPTVTADYAAGPDGTTTAERIQFNQGAGTTVSDRSMWTAPTNTGLTIGNPVYISFWAKRNSGTSQTLLVQPGALSSTNNVVTVTNVWALYTVSAGNAVATSGKPVLGLRGTFTTGATADVLITDVMVSQTPGAYIPTGASAVTVTDYTSPATGFAQMAVAPSAGSIMWGVSEWTNRLKQRILQSATSVGVAESFVVVGPLDFNSHVLSLNGSPVEII